MKPIRIDVRIESLDVLLTSLKSFMNQVPEGSFWYNAMNKRTLFGSAIVYCLKNPTFAISAKPSTLFHTTTMTTTTTTMTTGSDRNGFYDLNGITH